MKKNTFKLLIAIKKYGILSYRELSEKAGVSIGYISKELSALNAQGLVDCNGITEAGLKALEPYKVRNAVIMAAGMSSRFAPLSYEKPKGLLIVKGEVLIERQIRQLREAGIECVVIVVGYMKEKFFYLQEKFGVDIVVNEDYYRYNNISSVYCVLDKLGNSYICSSDNYFTENVFEPYVYDSYYAAQYSEGYTDEWAMKCDRSGLITHVTVGGSDCFYMVGHAFFSNSFSEKIVQLIREEYDLPGVKDGYWENLYVRHLNELKMYVRKYDDGLICEFDSMEDLRNFDKAYLKNVDSKIFDNIQSVLQCSAADISVEKVIKNGTSNKSFLFSCKGKKFIYKHPDVSSESYISFSDEYLAVSAANAAGLDTHTEYVDVESGWKILSYIEGSNVINCEDFSQVKASMSLIRRLHNAKLCVDSSFDILSTVNKYDAVIGRQSRDSFDDYITMRTKFGELLSLTESDGWEKCLCHGDFCPQNILSDREGALHLIDWEYSKMADPASDIGTFIACSNFSSDEIDKIIECYFNHNPSISELRHMYAYIAIMAYYWFIWGIYQESIGKIIGTDLLTWYRYFHTYYEIAISLYTEGKMINNTDKKMLADIAKMLFPSCVVAESSRLGGLTNRSYKVTLNDGNEYVFRLPGEGTEDMINREYEKRSTELACGLGIDTELLYFDALSGVKVMRFIKDAQTMSAESMKLEENILAAADLFKKLHTCGKDTGVPFEVFDMAADYEKIIKANNVSFYDDYEEVRLQVMALKDRVDRLHPSKAPCHNDSLCENWIREGDRLYLIDWEYAGMNDPFWDLADLSIEADYNKKQDEILLCRYLGHDPSENDLLRFTANKIYLDFLWSLWGKTRVPFDGEEMEKYAFDRYMRLKENLK